MTFLIDRVKALAVRLGVDTNKEVTTGYARSHAALILARIEERLECETDPHLYLWARLADLEMVAANSPELMVA